MARALHDAVRRATGASSSTWTEAEIGDSDLGRIGARPRGASSRASSRTGSGARRPDLDARIDRVRPRLDDRADELLRPGAASSRSRRRTTLDVHGSGHAGRGPRRRHGTGLRPRPPGDEPRCYVPDATSVGTSGEWPECKYQGGNMRRRVIVGFMAVLAASALVVGMSATVPGGRQEASEGRCAPGRPRSKAIKQIKTRVQVLPRLRNERRTGQDKEPYIQYLSEPKLSPASRAQFEASAEQERRGGRHDLGAGEQGEVHGQEDGRRRLRPGARR